MNLQILNQYKIEFELIDNSIPNIKQTEVTDTNFAISSYLSLIPYVNYLNNENRNQANANISGSFFKDRVVRFSSVIKSKYK